MPGAQLEPFVISCLACGATRATARTETGHLDFPECPRCGYLGWRESGGRVALAFEEWRLPQPSAGSPAV